MQMILRIAQIVKIVSFVAVFGVLISVFALKEYIRIPPGTSIFFLGLFFMAHFTEYQIKRPEYSTAFNRYMLLGVGLFCFTVGLISWIQSI